VTSSDRLENVIPAHRPGQQNAPELMEIGEREIGKATEQLHRPIDDVAGFETPHCEQGADNEGNDGEPQGDGDRRTAEEAGERGIVHGNIPPDLQSFEHDSHSIAKTR
jgi:hypothetical protein